MSRALLLLVLACTLLGCGTDAATQPRQSPELGPSETSAFVPAGDGWVVSHRWPTTRFELPADGSGVGLVRHTERVTMRATAVGRGGRLVDLAPVVRTSLDAGRLDYYRADGTVEWYRHTPLGLEQGFTLSTPPAPEQQGGALLVIAVQMDGAVLAAGPDQAVDLRVDGRTLFRYAKLAAFDADGTRLPSWMSMAGRAVHLVVDDRGARYPLVVDPLTFGVVTSFTGSTTWDNYGSNTVLDGTRLVVSADYAGSSDSGEIHTYTFDGSSWAAEQVLTASPPASQGYFGRGMAVQGSRLLAGGPRYDNGLGSVFVFTHDGSAWSQEDVLSSPLTEVNSNFGNVIALDGDRAVVGAPYADTVVSDGGAAFAYQHNGTAWTYVADVTPSALTSNDHFGEALALDGDTLAIGVPNGHPLGNASVRPGAVYVFVWSGTQWQLEQELHGDYGTPSSGFYAGFGASVALEGNTLVVGADEEDHDTSQDTEGAVYVFERSGSTWAQQARLTADAPKSYRRFGYSVALDGDLVVVSAFRTSSTSDGAAFAFEREAGNWSQSAKILSPGTTPWAGCCAPVAVDLPWVAVVDEHNQAGGDYSEVFIYKAGLSLGDPCTSDTECASDHCADGVCCDAPCGDDPGDCQACTLAGGATANGSCTVLPASTVCREATAPCDAAETCDGAATSCPADGLAVAGTECRPAAGDCDVAESCDGSSDACPSDGFAPDGTTCDDGLACTTGDRCVQGSCAGAQNNCSPPGSSGDEDDGGCGCHQPGRASAPWWPAALGMAAWALARRRRRR